MIPKAFDEIALPDVEALLDMGASESRTLEYKLELPTGADSSRIPFLSEVCALANTSGGDLVFGVAEDRGVPTGFPGVVADDEDATLLQIEQAMRTGLEPKLTQPKVKFIRADDGRKFLLVRVQRSWNAPHRVSYKEHSRFYGRHSSGKYPMDVTELRTAFLQSQGPAASARAFRAERVARIKANTDLPVQIERNGHFALHLVPLGSIDGQSRIDMAELSRDTAQSSQLAPIDHSGWSRRTNMDGLVTYWGHARDGLSAAYTQLFRTGAIEAVYSFGTHQGRALIPSQAYEESAIKFTRSYLKFLGQKEIPLPIVVFINLLGVRTHRFGVNRERFWGDAAAPLDRDDLLMPELLCEDYSQDIASLLKPAFDVVWQAFGFERSFNYDEKGKWAPAL